jgi:hypothetical protein
MAEGATWAAGREPGRAMPRELRTVGVAKGGRALGSVGSGNGARVSCPGAGRAAATPTTTRVASPEPRAVPVPGTGWPASCRANRPGRAATLFGGAVTGPFRSCRPGDSDLETRVVRPADRPADRQGTGGTPGAPSAQVARGKSAVPLGPPTSQLPALLVPAAPLKEGGPPVAVDKYAGLVVLGARRWGPGQFEEWRGIDTLAGATAPAGAEMRPGWCQVTGTAAEGSFI